MITVCTSAARWRTIAQIGPPLSLFRFLSRHVKIPDINKPENITQQMNKNENTLTSADWILFYFKKNFVQSKRDLHRLNGKSSNRNVSELNFVLHPRNYFYDVWKQETVPLCVTKEEKIKVLTPLVCNYLATCEETNKETNPPRKSPFLFISFFFLPLETFSVSLNFNSQKKKE